MGGDGGGCEVEEGDDMDCSHLLDSRGEEGQTKGDDAGGCESEG